MRTEISLDDLGHPGVCAVSGNYHRAKVTPSEKIKSTDDIILESTRLDAWEGSRSRRQSGELFCFFANIVLAVTMSDFVFNSIRLNGSTHGKYWSQVAERENTSYSSLAKVPIRKE